MEIKSLPIHVKSLPSKGNFYPDKDGGGNGKETVLFLKQMTYKQVQTYESELAECKMLTQKLLCKIEHLIGEEFRDAPVCDMYSIMSHKCLFSIAGERTKFIMKDVPCNKCGKIHDELTLDISEIQFAQIDDKILTSNSVILGGKNFTFIMPSIRAFEYVLKQLLGSAAPKFARGKNEKDLSLYLKRLKGIEVELIKTALLISAFNSYEYIDETGQVTLQSDPTILRDTLENVTGKDIILLELYYNFLLSPTSYVNDYCNCGLEPGPSVAIVSDIVTEVLRQLYANSRLT